MDGSIEEQGTQRGTSNDNCLFIDVWSAQIRVVVLFIKGNKKKKERNSKDGMTERNETGTHNFLHGGGGGGRGGTARDAGENSIFNGVYNTRQSHTREKEISNWGERKNSFPIYVTNIIQTEKKWKRKKLNKRKSERERERKKTNRLNPAPWEVTRHTHVCVCAFFSLSLHLAVKRRENVPPFPPLLYACVYSSTVLSCVSSLMNQSFFFFLLKFFSLFCLFVFLLKK